MCIVPGLEGHHRRFSSLCEQLKLPALVLQPGLDHLQETVEELALRYSKVINYSEILRSGSIDCIVVLTHEIRSALIVVV